MRAGRKLYLLAAIAAVIGVVNIAGASGGWHQVAGLPSPYAFTGSAPLAVLNGQIYALCGTGGPYPDTSGCREFWRYDPGSDVWTRLADIPANTNFYGGATLVATGDSIYAHPGGFWYYTYLWRYSPAADTWQRVTKFPSNTNIEWGTSMAWAGGDHIYVHLKYAEDGFYRLHLPTRTWHKLPNPPFNPVTSWPDPPFSVGPGSSLIWTGGDDLYLNRGLGYPYNWPFEPGPALARYSISNGTWTSLATPPTYIVSAMAWDGADAIYARSGTGVYTYSISNDAWTQLEDFPAAGVAYDFDLFMAAGSFYTADFRFSSGFWRLSLNTPPVALCKNVLLEAGPECEAYGSVDAGSYDLNGDAVLITETPGGPFVLGDTDVELTIEDSFDTSDTCVGTVTVVDPTPPAIDAVDATPDSLWPPNHKMVAVNLVALATDACDLVPECSITNVDSNEPETGCGSGKKKPDWVITGDLSVDLRAERCGTGNARVYTIEVMCADDAGNAVSTTTEVLVAHDQ